MTYSVSDMEETCFVPSGHSGTDISYGNKTTQKKCKKFGRKKKRTTLKKRDPTILEGMKTAIKALLMETPINKTWQVYMILCSDDSLYTGITTDMQRRFVQHESRPGG